MQGTVYILSLQGGLADLGPTGAQDEAISNYQPVGHVP